MDYTRLGVALIAGLLLAAVGQAPASAACPPPQTFENPVLLQDEEVLVSFASDRRTYAVGQVIEFYLSFENTGNQPIHIPCPYNPEFKILIFPDTCLAPQQPGCDNLGTTRFRLPEGVYWFSPGIYMDPGECYVVPSLQTTWNSQTSSWFPPLAGGYRAFGGLPGTGGPEFSVPSGGAELTFTVAATGGIPEENPPEKLHLPRTWGAIKALYR